MGAVDAIVEEPAGGAHVDYDEAARRLDDSLWQNLTALDELSKDELVADRYRRFRSLGSFHE